MKILLLTSNDAHTSGAIAVNRLHKTYLEIGHESLVLIGSSRNQSAAEISLQRPFVWKSLDWANRTFFGALSLPDLTRPSYFIWEKFINRFNPDVIHIHWAYGSRGSNCIPLTILPSISKRYPLFWTFHDMWALTGGCTNSLDCNRWLTGCGNCPQVGGTAAAKTLDFAYDTTRLMWKIKKWIFNSSAFSIICPSQWLNNLVLKSPLLNKKPVYRIPNGIDLNVFCPQEKALSKQLLGIPEDRYVLLFIGKSNTVFGYKERVPIFVEAVQKLKEIAPDLVKKLTVLIVGEKGEQLEKSIGLPAVCMGPVTDPAKMANAYSAADLFVTTTQYDNLPGVVQESLACGTPVIASRVGGIPEMVQDQHTGFVVKKDDPLAFATNIKNLLENNSLRYEMGKNCRSFAVQNYDRFEQASKILKIYQTRINQTQEINLESFS